MDAENREPLVSVITVCLNAEHTIRKTLLSIASQTYKQIQYIVIDGGSSDGTLEHLKEFRDEIDILISEPDSGISDAFNKGIALAQGEFIQIVNADDYLPSEKIEKSVRLLLRHENAAFVFGDQIVLDSKGIPKFVSKGDPNYSFLLGRPISINFGASIGASRIKWCCFFLWDF